jgi:hypothetical protein
MITKERPMKPGRNYLKSKKGLICCEIMQIFRSIKKRAMCSSLLPAVN